MIVRDGEGPHTPLPDHHPDCVPRVLFVMPSWPPKVIVLESLTPGDTQFSDTKRCAHTVYLWWLLCAGNESDTVVHDTLGNSHSNENFHPAVSYHH
mmetsp:Transcript_30733/g.34512  ORF Transcript_30733/g.34512 Transcript_30733/m.34512 type:complete len:96 (+) Transcript_30733:104-391(+)